MVPNADAKQLTLNDNGQIFWQPDPTNPLPGVAVARVVKGDAPLAPGVELLPELPLVGEARDIALAQLNDWLVAHIHRVLEPLVKLKLEIEGTPEPVRAICDRVYEGLGIVPRADVMDQIEKLDAETRKTLRGRHVRLGPVLVFVPDLNKPAAVRLRALLWSLWHDRALPAPTPRDGAVSQVVDAATADPAFYRAIGYPLYANRVIRIDMLDRVMNAVYEGVKDNKFTATHQMAEWLGAPVADLYAVLESMGHKKISDPAEVKPVDGTTPVNVGEAADACHPREGGDPAPSAPETFVAVVAPVETASTETAPTETASADASTTALSSDAAVAAPGATPPKKPELATFRVWWPRKGGPKSDAPREHRPRGPKKPYTPRTAAPAVDGAAPASADSASPDAAKPDRRSFRHRDRAPRRDGADGDRPDGARKFGARSAKAGGDDKPPAPREGRNVGGRFGGGGRGSGMVFGDNAKGKHKEKPTRTDKTLRMVATSTPSPSAEGQADNSPFAILGTLKF